MLSVVDFQIIAEFYFQDEQEAIYRYMGDICTDMIKQNLNDFRSK